MSNDSSCIDQQGDYFGKLPDIHKTLEIFRQISNARLE